MTTFSTFDTLKVMKVAITKIAEPDSSKAIFFDVLFNFDDPFGAVITPGWKVFDQKIYPPAKSWKGKYYPTLHVSPGVCKAVQAALMAQIPNLELDPEAYISAKWGQLGLKQVTTNPEQMLEIWKKYQYSPAADKVNSPPSRNIRFSPAGAGE